MRLTVHSPFSIVLMVDGSNIPLTGQTGDLLDVADEVARTALFYLPGILTAEQAAEPAVVEYEPPVEPPVEEPEPVAEVAEPEPEPEPEPPQPEPEPEPEPEIEEAVTVAEAPVVEMVQVPPQVVAPPRKARTRQIAAKPKPAVKPAPKPAAKAKVKGKPAAKKR